MAENEQNQAQDQAQNAQDQAPEQTLNMMSCYLKDASIEMPNAPAIFFEESGEPDVDIKFEVAIEQISPSLFESCVRSTISVKKGERTAILVEGKQAGIFQIEGFQEEAMVPLLNIYCPTMVYPYLRSNMADLMVRANVPPIHLPEVNFEMLFQQRMAELAAQQEQDDQSKKSAS